jgi:preprotein translocase subunit SecE
VAKQTAETNERAGRRLATAGGSRGGRGTGSGTSEGPRRGSPATFFQESRAELRKVTWPTREETMNLTVAVIGMTVGLAAFLGIIDAFLDFIVKPLIGGS